MERIKWRKMGRDKRRERDKKGKGGRDKRRKDRKEKGGKILKGGRRLYELMKRQTPELFVLTF